jgi:hypothetical protein
MLHLGNDGLLLGNQIYHDLLLFVKPFPTLLQELAFLLFLKVNLTSIKSVKFISNNLVREESV